MFYVLTSKKLLLPKICNKKRLRHYLLKLRNSNRKVWCDLLIIGEHTKITFYVDKNTSIRSLMRELTN